MSKPHVLLIQDVLYPYRVPILDLVAREVDLEVACLENRAEEGTPFPVTLLKAVSIGKIRLIPGLLGYCNRFDVVILQPHLSRLSVCLLPFRNRRTFIPVSWDIGMRVSYERAYTLDTPMQWDDRIYRHILRHCAANLFYMPEPVPVWTARGVPAETLFVAHNTVAVSQTPYSPEGRKDFLFLGSLYPQKRVDLLIDAYREARADCGNPGSFPILHIVGGGSEEPFLMDKVVREGLEDNVVFHHAIYDEAVLSRLFQQSLLCISPHQAGLSILKSFAYGTPFVTRRDAITGGELYNIRNGENGILYELDTELAPILSDAAAHPDKYLEMGRAAHRFYAEEAAPAKMARGILDAVHYALQHPV
jgi:glycosyltransferase involved in cell wall biosynthesis